MELIKVSNLSFSYGENKILDNINISFASNGLYIILGKSGSGKSTFLSLLIGSIIPSSGSISFYNNIKPAISFQSSLLLEYLSVKDNIALSLMFNNIKDNKDEIINNILKEVNLESKKDSSVKNLSGGEKMRVSIGRALAYSSKILILDEPTGSLDETTSKEIYDLLINLSKNHLIIVVTHDEKNAYLIASYLYELKDGNLKLIKKNDSESINNNTSVDLSKTDSMSIKDGLYINYKYLIKHKLRVLVCSLFLVFSFSFLYLSLNIYFNLNTSINNMLSNYYSDVTSISKIERVESTSNISLERISLPKNSDLNNLGINKVYSSLEYFIPEYQEIYLNNIYADCRYIPVINEDTNKLIIGDGLKDASFVVVNESFVNAFNLDINSVLNKRIYLYHHFLVEIEDVEESDLCLNEKEFIISGVSKESKTFNEPIIYYSYKYMYEELDNIICENISISLDKITTLKEILDVNSVKNSDLNSHKYLFIDTNNNISSSKSDLNEYKFFSKTLEVRKSTKELIESIIQIFIIYLVVFIISTTLLLFLSIYSLYDNNIRLFSLIKVFSHSKNNSIKICLSNGIIFYLLNTILLIINILILSPISKTLLTKINMPPLIKSFDILSFVILNISMLFLILLTSIIPLLKIKDNRLKKELEGED